MFFDYNLRFLERLLHFLHRWNLATIQNERTNTLAADIGEYISSHGDHFEIQMADINANKYHFSDALFHNVLKNVRH